MQEINEKNTKSEILKAYDELLTKVREGSQNNRKIEKEAQDKRELVDKAASNSNEQIINHLASLKLGIVTSLNQLTDQMIAEFKQLSMLRQAVTTEREHIKELHEINVSADTLTALLLGQKEQKQAFETEMQLRRQDWDEYKTKVKKEHEREEEVYAYKTNLERQKDSDAYIAKKTALESELANRKAAFEQEWTTRTAEISAREQELKELREQVTNFPGSLQKAIDEVKVQTEQRLLTQHGHESQLKAKEYDGELKLLKQMVASLESTIEQKNQQLTLLTEKANRATGQVQEIAMKAIEGASISRQFGLPIGGRSSSEQQAS